jgi:hypothetical protein
VRIEAEKVVHEIRRTTHHWWTVAEKCTLNFFSRDATKEATFLNFFRLIHPHEIKAILGTARSDLNHQREENNL